MEGEKQIVSSVITRKRKATARGRFWLLPVYGKIRSLHKALYENTRKDMPKDVQISAVAPMREEVRKMLIRIIKANETHEDKERVRLLIENLQVIEDFKLELRSMHDCRYLTHKGFRKIATLAKNCRRQMEGWAKASGGDPNDFPHVFKILKSDFIEEEEQFFLGDTPDAISSVMDDSSGPAVASEGRV